ncbi:SLC13 family permease [Mucisphaera calidilacus]|uniref:Sodium-dependent dicarboxylate transporter SdcS n=1 Tax=Mucisphaera calidilacus TaxID=2527982 RepID=A0A518BUN5_9BACT|nr:SLC13 family permease [Mucisphaera calidilacus]QDU70702.1 Sodium-dependent dicarboxylate transporter SdcS [Mucisphaera calidilacus]
MPWEAWTTLATLAAMILILAANVTGPDVILMGTLALLATVGLFSERMPHIDELFLGFGSQGPITIALLYVVAAGLRHTGATELMSQWFLGRPTSATTAQARVMPTAAGLSAFLSNTAVVAVFLPAVGDLARKCAISPSKLLIPLSYAAILGGMCTLIGTSTNLVVNGRMLEDPRVGTGLGMFDLAWVGLPCALLGFIYLLVVGRWLLPDRKPAIDRERSAREYAVEMIVEPDGPLVGSTIEAAGLRHLPGLYLTEIQRDQEILAAVGPDQKLRANDRLVFVGIVASVVDLRKIRGLKPAEDQVYKLNAPRASRKLIEAVVSNRCPLVHKTIRDGRFRSVYNAAVIAVARDGQRLQQKIGDVVLQPGDTLLMEAPASFSDQRRYSQDFYLVSPIEDSTIIRHERAWLAITILGLLVVSVGLEWLTLMHGALLAAGLMWLTRCCTASEARQSIDWQILIVIGCAIGIGQAVAASGAADGIVAGLMTLTGGSPLLSLLALFLLANLFTELMTNVAAALLVYPIALATAERMQADPLPLLVIVMIAASASFITPIGYQTNLMVYGPGGYRYADYARIGLPLMLIVLVTTIFLTPLIWPL